MNIRVAVAKAVALLRRDGVAALIGRALWYAVPHKLPSEPFDIERGTDTSGVTPVWKLGVNSINSRFAVQYQATDPDELADAIAFSGIASASSVFIDLGCGKGRTLIVAAELGFKRVVGVDFSPALVDIAAANLAKLAITNASVICLDAAQYSFPDEDFVLYLYNPFSAEVMRHVLENLRASRAETILVIYKRPLCHDIFDRGGFLARIGSPAGNDDVVLWKSQMRTDSRAAVAEAVGDQ